MRKGDMAGWIESAAQDRLWNVVVIGSNKNHRDMEGQVIPLGDTDLGFKTAVPNVNRAPLQNPESFTGTANIKALMSHMDWFADLDPAIIRALDDGEKYDPRGVRRQYADGRGLIAIYPVSKDSVPMGAIAIRTGARRRMEADENLIGLGVIFPDVDREGFAAEGTYYSVHPDWEPSAADDDDDEIPEDTEPIGDSPPSGQDSGPS